MFLWIGFLVCTAVIVYSGTKLSKYGDIIAEKSGMGRAWTGLILMASVTSLPELITGISSVTYADVPDITVGDVLGSCVFNMLILALLDTLQKEMPISTKAHHGHVLSGGFGIIMLGVVVLSLFLGNRVLPLGWIGPYTILFMVSYLVGVRLIYYYNKKELAAFVKEMAVELRYKESSTKSAVIHYTLNALVVIIAAVFLPGIGAGIAESTGLGQSFVGNIFIALSTSLPEVVVCFTAVRMGAVDLAIGNLFGSNIFNIFILGIDDIFFVKGPLLAFVSPNHMISALSAIIMTAIAIIGLTYHVEKKPLFLSWDSIVIVFVYILNLMLLYMVR